VQDGLSVDAHGRISVYEPSGQYQLVVDIFRPAGEGALYAEFMRLKALLEGEGLFSVERKRPIVEFPHRIGIVTSASGAALQDMLNVLRRRLPLVEVVLAASPVQGADAPPALVLALQRMNTIVKPDVILLARGGGSIEDLWAFNDERVVRAVAASQAPVISGVGHETDFTLVDFAADLRAPTPTAAAELATPYTLLDLAGGLQAGLSRLEEALQRKIDFERSELEGMQTGLRYYSPRRRLQTESQLLDDLLRRGMRALNQRLALQSAHLAGASNRLKSLSPLSVLSRGYAVVTSSHDGSIIQDASQAAPGSELGVRLAGGKLNVKVQESFPQEA
jgi:exodeoxyribonuclease VII large subunit